MIKLNIDNRTFEVQEGRTILSIAKEGGISIPTLCHYDGIEDDASCLICTVKNKKDGSLIPACATFAVDGMDITTKSKDVILYRKKIIELLLLEHRAECLAPCSVKCPASYNIPLLNRLLSDGKIKDALALIVAETGHSPIRCISCRGYCEDVCRRGKIDAPVSIRSIRMFIFSAIKDSAVKINEEEPLLIKEKQFLSKSGVISDQELSEWLKECNISEKRISNIEDYISAGYEAGNCMHCDCRAEGDCRLRTIATELGIKDNGDKFDSYVIQKKISKFANLVYENGKCIKCGLCVRACNDMDGRPALTFQNRGSNTTISEPLWVDFSLIPADKAEIFVNICPTGALRKIK